MSGLPAAREVELEQFAETLFPFVGLWSFWVKIYDGRAEYWRVKAEVLEKAGTDPERAKEYRRREEVYRKWTESVSDIAAPAIGFASIIAVALGGKFVDGIFVLTKAEPPPA